MGASAEVTQPTTKGISTNRNLSALAAALSACGIEFAFRYYSRTTHQPQKRLTAAEAAALGAAGIQVAVVYEDAPLSAAYFTEARGKLDGASAVAEAAALGQPQGSAIYFAVDYDALPHDISGAVCEYFAGVNEAMAGKGYAIGVYGSGAVCQYLKANCPFVQYTWLAESRGWSGTKAYTAWNVIQTVSPGPLAGLGQDDYELCEARSPFGAFILAQSATP